MKKRFIAITIIISCITSLLAGCGVDYSSEELPTETVQNKFPDFSFDSNEKPYYQKDNHITAVAENGYYFVRNVSSIAGLDNFTRIRYFRLEPDRYQKGQDSGRSYGKMIYFYDVNSGIVTPLCSKIDCKHDNMECQAYFDTTEGEQYVDGGGFVYYKHRLYMIEYDAKTGIKLISFDNNGNNQRDECVINDNPEYMPYVGGNNDVCIFNGCVYSWAVRNVSSADSESYEIVLLKTDISDEKTETLLTLKETAEQYKVTYDNTFSEIQIADDIMYVKTCSLDVENNMYTFVLYETTGAPGEPLKEILRTKSPCNCDDRVDGESYACIKSFVVDNDRNIYYVDEVNGPVLNIDVVLYKYNLDTKVKTKLWEKTEIVGYRIECADDYIYLNCIVGRPDVPNSFIVMDMDGNKVYVKEYFEDFGDCTLVGADDRYLIFAIKWGIGFTFDGEEITQKTEQPDTYRIAALRKDTIGTGNEEWIQLYNGMFIQ
ncbi:MAG: hypothetical protein ACLSW1_07175 [Lachnospira sp.]